MRPPSIDALANALADTGLPHPLLVDAARQAVEACREATPGAIEDEARRQADAITAALLQPVINATGVLLHTNLGRSPLGPLPPSATSGYRNVELDLDTGRRGSRSSHAASLLARAADAEAALVVNNGAAAVLLALAAVAGPAAKVVVSRGELVEIGGSFRVPEVAEQSGVTLVEVGTTNRTRLRDYEAAVADHGVVAAVLKVHPSNYRITGFTESTPVGELGRLGPPVIADLGSGLLDAGCPWLPGGRPAWLGDEPAVRQTLAAGAALVTFSGDKLLGGPQAGVIAGQRALVERCSRHPLARALRPGALVLGALQETALAYLRRDGAAIPFWRMATTHVDELQRRATAIAADVAGAEVTACASVSGGGSAPGATIPSAGVAVKGDVTRALRAGRPAVVARVAAGRTVCDLRTVEPGDDQALAKSLGAAASP